MPNVKWQCVIIIFHCFFFHSKYLLLQPTLFRRTLLWVWTTITWGWATGREMSQPEPCSFIFVTWTIPPRSHLTLTRVSTRNGSTQFWWARSQFARERSPKYPNRNWPSIMQNPNIHKCSEWWSNLVVLKSDHINQPNLIIRLDQIVKTYMFVEHVSRNVRIVCVWLGAGSCNCQKPGNRNEYWSQSCIVAQSEIMCCVNKYLIVLQTHFCTLAKRCARKLQFFKFLFKHITFHHLHTIDHSGRL